MSDPNKAAVRLQVLGRHIHQRARSNSDGIATNNTVRGAAVFIVAFLH